MVRKIKSIIKELKKRKVAQHRADVNIGKKGIYDGIVNEIRRRLEQEGVVKIRVLKSARQKVSDKDIEELAKKLDAIVVDSRGYTYIIVSPKYAAKLAKERRREES